MAKRAAEEAGSLEGYEKWMSGGGIRQWMRQRKRECMEGSSDWESTGVKKEGSGELLQAEGGYWKMAGEQSRAGGG